MQRSSIEWTDQTWNPMRGCTEISPGCDHCYARTFAERFRGVPNHPYENGFDFRLAPHKLDEPLKIPTPRMIFVNSMSDLFYCKAPTEYIRDVAEVMLTANWHIYQVLTKRSPRLKKLLNSNDEVFRAAAEAPHIWWGVSAEDKNNGHRRIQHLQETRAHTRWVSFEPLLEDIMPFDLAGIDWAVVGGESGAGSRTMKRQWANSIMQECRYHDIPFHFKQWGGVHKKENGRTLNGRTYDEWPACTREPVLLIDKRTETIEKLQKKIQVWSGHTLAIAK